MIANETTLQKKTKLSHKLTTIGYRTAFKKGQSPYRIVSYKRPRNSNVKQFKREKLTVLFMYKKERKTKR